MNPHGLLAVLAAALLALPAVAQERQFRAGTHYQVLPAPQPTATEPGAEAVEVAEVFAYTCVYCYRFEPQLEAWQAAKPDYVQFVRIPAVFDSLRELHARAHYTAEALGKLEEMHLAFFREIHEQRNSLASEQALQEFFARFGVDAASFKSTFDSFGVQTKVRRAAELMRRYRIPETPAIVVDGKYLSLGGMAGGSYDTWFAIIEELAAVEHGG